MELKYIKKINDNYKTINDIINLEFSISTRLRTKLLKNNCILLNDMPTDTRTNIKLGDIICVKLDYDEESLNIISTKMNLDIVYEDEWFLIINKPAGIAIHPSILHYEDSISNGIKFYFDSIGLKKKIRPVNRLDLNTSGLVIFAKCEYIQECFSCQMKSNIFKKYYLAIANGIFEKKTGTINLPIARKPGSIIERYISENGQYSVTHYSILQDFENYSLVQCSLETGRTHQIRVHMLAIRAPTTSAMIYMGLNQI